MTDENEHIDMVTRRKRLVYRSNYRGFKEADLILGGYAKANIGEKDHDIYGWIMGAIPVPAKFDTPLMKRLRAFNPVQ